MRKTNKNAPDAHAYCRCGADWHGWAAVDNPVIACHSNRGGDCGLISSETFLALYPDRRRRIPTTIDWKARAEAAEARCTALQQQLDDTRQHLKHVQAGSCGSCGDPECCPPDECAYRDQFANEAHWKAMQDRDALQQQLLDERERVRSLAEDREHWTKRSDEHESASIQARGELADLRGSITRLIAQWRYFADENDMAATSIDGLSQPTRAAVYRSTALMYRGRSNELEAALTPQGEAQK